MVCSAQRWKVATAGLASFICLGVTATSPASDHLDTPTVMADPRADIGDIYAWTSSDGKRLNLVMTIVGHTFSDKLDYVFHIDSGARFGVTTATTSIVCRFPAAKQIECRGGDADVARCDASPNFDRATSQAILDEWHHTDGGPGTNFLAGWTPASIVISIDLEVVGRGGRLLAVWGATVSPQRQIDRAARPLTGNALLGTLSPEDVAFQLKEEYNAATPATSARFIEEIQKWLALYDGFDGKCGNQLLADVQAAPAARYRALATLLADDRLWVNSASTVCTQLFAVELANLAGRRELSNDCGGRTPNYDAVNVYRSLLVDASNNSVDDGVHRDERVHSATIFPFLAAPDTQEGGTAKGQESAYQ